MNLLPLLLASRVLAYDSINLKEAIKLDGSMKPVAVAASATRVYVVDEKKAQLFLYDLSGKMLKATGHQGADKNGFAGPRGVAVGPDGKVFVADTGNSRVQILDADGEFVGSFGVRGSEPGELRNPESVAVGLDGRVYVADTGNDRVQVFTPEGILLFQLGTKGKEAGQFRGPTRVNVDPSDNLYVLDSGNGRIQKFDSQARPMSRELSLLGNDFAVDAYGFLYILDGKSGRVIEENPEGFIQGKFGSAGSGPGQMKKAEGIAVAPDGAILVADTGNLRLHHAELANKAKTLRLPPNLATKVLASGPSKLYDAAAEALAATASEIYAWLPKDGQLAVLGEDGKEKQRIGAKGAPNGPQTTRAAKGLAVSRKHGLFVSDAGNNRIQHFSPDGTWKENVAESTGLFDSKKKEGRVKDPRGVAINEQGTIYVADAGNRRVDAFSPEGVFLFGIGPTVGSLELKEPTAVAWDSARFVYFLDRELKKVVKCEPSGAYLASWGEPGTGPGQFEDPVALAFDGRSYLYVLDAKLKRVSVYSKDGKWMTDLFAGGTDEHALKEPVAVAVQGSKLLIADKGRGKILAFDLHFRLEAPQGLAAATKDGSVNLTWKAVSDVWTDGYAVLRAEQAEGPWTELGKTEAPKFTDTKAAAYAKYYYAAATRAKTGDAGVPTAPVEVTVAGSFNKAPVELSTITIGNIFSANYKWYLKNPIGKAVVTNNVNAPFEKVKVTFRLKDFMDFGYDQEIKTLAPQERVEIPLIATLNNKILDVSEDTPIQAEFTLTYFEDGQQRNVSLTKPLRVYSRNAITWDDPQRIANFITPKDPPVLEFGRQAVRETPKDPKAQALNESVVKAAQVWELLSEYGVSFFANPSNPYETISEDPNFPVDYTQFPRETLKRKSGQCDDLTTLLISMLDGAKVKSAVVDYPGHMALMFDTEAEDAAQAGLPEDKLIKHEGTYWVPLEATLVGKPFTEAVAKAAQAMKAEQEKGKVRIVSVGEAWKQYEPATMPATDWSPEAPKPEASKARLDKDVATLFDWRYEALRKLYASRTDADAQVELGLLEHEAGKDDEAAERFNKAVAADPKNAAALNNLGNLAYLKGDFAGAEKQYLAAAEADANDPDVWLNLTRAAAKQKAKDKAAEYGAKAVALDGTLSPVVETLTKGL